MRLKTTIVLLLAVGTIGTMIAEAPVPQVGRIYGSVTFAAAQPHGEAEFVPNVLLSFRQPDNHYHFVFSDQNGTYDLYVPPGQYCVTAYAVPKMVPMPLVKEHPTCVMIKKDNDSIEFDIPLVRTGSRVPQSHVPAPSPTPRSPQ
ncbi:MAG TPA: hypothetical protein VFR24_05325 [Candidatus Angelobacter sp.]|nr:hypothetical protein [Candidatus Angelobacter sp.]